MLLLLLGPPGSGKTSLGRILAQRLNYKWVDVDDHVLEPEWRCSVSEKLCQLGDSRFIEEEGRLLKTAASTFGSGTVVSLTGSNPMDTPVMNVLQARKDAIFIYLDVNYQDILERLGAMKVCRIVGACSGGLSIDHVQGNGADSEEEIENASTSEHILKILQARATLYERHFDLRIWPRIGVTIPELEIEILQELDNHIKGRYDAFTSTREKNDRWTWGLAETILEGLAPERGLFVPKRSLPVLSQGVLHRLSRLRYQEKAKIILEKLVHSSRCTPQKLDSIIKLAFNSSHFNDSRIVPLVQIGNTGMFISELFHGPSGSFKDLSLQLLPQLIAGLMTPRERNIYLVATSGDTGSAVLCGFDRLSEEDKQRVAVVVLYPTDGVSPIQKQQMVSHSARNVAVVGIRGDFDVCQNLVKTLMNQELTSQHLLSEFGVTFNTANSINWGRILFQIVYHIHSYLSLVQRGTIRPGDPVDVCIPTGNLGNILSAFLSMQMGVPYSRIVCASNSNKILSDFFATGVYDLRNRHLVKTMSPSIDILVSSNLERLLWFSLGSQRVIQLYQDLRDQLVFKLTNEELEKVTQMSNLRSGWCDESECRETLKRVFEDHNYCMDPHTAIAFTVGQRLRSSHDRPMIIASTAHYSKFWQDIEPILTDGKCGQKIIPRLPKRHDGVESCLNKPAIHTTVLSPNVDEIYKFISKFASTWFRPLTPETNKK